MLNLGRSMGESLESVEAAGEAGVEVAGDVGGVVGRNVEGGVWGADVARLKGISRLASWTAW